MFDFGQILIYTIVILAFFVIPLIRLFSFKRKYDSSCFICGYYICIIFLYLIIYAIIITRFDLVPEIISSAVIALLTLAFVWTELSKRPEIIMLGSVPIVHDIQTLAIYKADYHGALSEPSRFLGVREASFAKTNNTFDEKFSFAVDLANIGYEEIMVHEYVLWIDGKRQKPIPLGNLPHDERLRLITQQRHPINMPPLNIKNAGLHKISIEAIATAEVYRKGVWFFISDDFKKLKYVDIDNPLNRLLSHLLPQLIKKALKTS